MIQFRISIDPPGKEKKIRVKEIANKTFIGKSLEKKITKAQ